MDRIHLGNINGTFHRAVSGSFLSGAAIYMIANILQKAAAFLLIPLYTRYLSPQEFGITGITQGVNQILVITLSLGITSAVQRHFYDYMHDSVQLRQYVSSTFLFLVCVVSAASLGVLLIGKWLWNAVLADVPFVPFAQLTIPAVWGTVLTQYALNLYQARQEAGRYVAIQIGSFVLTITVSIYLVVFRRLGASGQLIGVLAGSVFAAVTSSVFLFKNYLTLHISWEFIRKSLAYGMPLIPHLAAQWVKTSLDRVLLAQRAGLDEVGLYTLGVNLGLGMQVLVISINQAYAPSFFEMLKTHPHPKEQFRKFVALYVTGLGLVCMVGVLFGREVVRLVAPPAYYPATKIVPLVLYAFLINGYYFLFVNPLFYYEKTSWIPWLSGTSAVASVALNLVLIPKLGAVGAALSLVVSMILAFALTLAVSRRFWRVELPYGGYAASTVMIGLAALWMTYGRESVATISSVWLRFFALGAYMILAGTLLSREMRLSIDSSQGVGPAHDLDLPQDTAVM